MTPSLIEEAQLGWNMDWIGYVRTLRPIEHLFPIINSGLINIVIIIILRIPLIILIFSKWAGDTCSDYLSSPMFRSLHRPRYWPKQVGDDDDDWE